MPLRGFSSEGRRKFSQIGRRNDRQREYGRRLINERIQLAADGVGGSVGFVAETSLFISLGFVFDRTIRTDSAHQLHWIYSLHLAGIDLEYDHRDTEAESEAWNLETERTAVNGGGWGRRARWRSVSWFRNQIWPKQAKEIFKRCGRGGGIGRNWYCCPGRKICSAATAELRNGDHPPVRLHLLQEILNDMGIFPLLFH